VLAISSDSWYPVPFPKRRPRFAYGFEAHLFASRVLAAKRCSRPWRFALATWGLARRKRGKAGLFVRGLSEGGRLSVTEQALHASSSRGTRRSSRGSNPGDRGAGRTGAPHRRGIGRGPPSRPHRLERGQACKLRDATAGPAVKLRRLKLLASRAPRVGGSRALGRN
jgi:hypothetical protein